MAWQALCAACVIKLCFPAVFKMCALFFTEHLKICSRCLWAVPTTGGALRVAGGGLLIKGPMKPGWLWSGGLPFVSRPGVRWRRALLQTGPGRRCYLWSGPAGCWTGPTRPPGEATAERPFTSQPLRHITVAVFAIKIQIAIKNNKWVNTGLYIGNSNCYQGHRLHITSYIIKYNTDSFSMIFLFVGIILGYSR